MRDSMRNIAMKIIIIIRLDNLPDHSNLINMHIHRRFLQEDRKYLRDGPTTELHHHFLLACRKKCFVHAPRRVHLVIVNIITKFAVVIRVSFVKISLETSQVIMENNSSKKMFVNKMKCADR